MGAGASLPPPPIPLPSRLTALIFDLDGTLIDSAAGIASCLDQISQDRGQGPVSPQQVRRLVSRGAAELVSSCLNSTDADADLKRFRALYGQRRTTRAELYDGVFDGVTRLAGLGLPLGICTNKPQHLTDRILDDVGLAFCFQAVVGGDAASGHKPDPAHLAEVSRRLKLPLSGSALVGDSEVDEAAARAASLPFLFVSYGYVMEQCRDFCRSFDDFPALLAAVVEGMSP